MLKFYDHSRVCVKEKILSIKIDFQSYGIIKKNLKKEEFVPPL